MKAFKLLLVLFLFLPFTNAEAQDYVDTTKTQKMVKVEKNDGTIYIGVVLKEDAREVLLKTEKLGELYIPKHEIKSITEIKQGDLGKNGEYIPEEVFATRYFITTNGLPIEKGESYIKWNLMGPDFQFGVGENFSLGIMTSWVASPLLASAKYSINVNEKFNIGLGTLLGTGSWASPDYFLGLPYVTATIGDRRSNISISGGYGFVAYKITESYYDTSGVYHERMVSHSEGRLLLSIGGMIKLGKSVSLVFDSFISPPIGNQQYSLSILIPGLRFQTDPDRAFQFGFTGVVYNDGSGPEVVPFPIPMVSWFRRLK